jgi:dynein heavy chain
VLFFVIKDLSIIDPMYQYSLQYIQKLFHTSMTNSESSSILEKRLASLINNITRDVYRNVTRGLFESHKKIFSFLIAVNINKESKLLSEELWSVFLRGAGLIDKFKKPMNPDKTVFSERSWDLAYSLDSRFPNFAGLTTHIISKLKMWLPYKEDPLNEKLPE